VDRIDDILIHRLGGDVELVVAVRRDTFDLAGLLLWLLPEDDNRFAGVDVDALVVADPVGDDFEVQLALAGDQVFTGVFVDLDLDRRILFGDLLEHLDELRQVVHRLRLDALRDDGLGDVFDRLEGCHLHAGDSRASDRILQAGDGGDVAGRNGLNLLAFATHEDPDRLDAVGARSAGNVELLALFDRSGEQSPRSDLAGVGIHRDIRRHEDNLAVLVDQPHAFGEIGVGVATPDRRDTTGLGVNRVREVLGDHVENDVRQRGSFLQFHPTFLAAAFKLHDVAEVDAGALHRRHRDAPLVERRPEADGAVFDGNRPVVVLLFGHPADELVDIGDHRQQPLLHLFGAFLKLVDEPVDLVDEECGLDTLPQCLPEDGLGLWHRALDGVDNDQRAVDGTHRACHVATEVDVARRVDEVDEVVGVIVLVGHRDVCRVDGDAAFLFVLLGVHRELFARGLVGDHARTGEQVVGQRRLPVVDVGGDGDIPDVLRIVHQPLTLVDDLLSSAHYTDGYRQEGEKHSVSPRVYSPVNDG